MQQFKYSVVRTARFGVDELDRIRRAQDISQMRISELADAPDVGQQYARMFGSGDAMLSKFLRFAHALGYELVMVKKEDATLEK